MKLLVCVEGLIGVGKSTLLDRMQKDSESNEYLRASILKEPVDEWRAVKVANTNMLQAMYDGQLPSSIFSCRSCNRATPRLSESCACATSM